MVRPTQRKAELKLEGEGGQDGVLMASLERLDPAIPEAD